VGGAGEMNSWLERQRILYPTNREDIKIAGVHVYVYTPKAGIAERNKSRVLIDLHGGGFDHCWPACAEAESMPMAGVGRFKVVAVDYRQGPQYKHPAGSEDVASVYKEILKTYRPENVAIYGCSAGGMLTAMSMAWFQKHDLPRPGAIGILCASAGSPGGMTITGGDAAYTTGPLGSARMASNGAGRGGGRGPGYFDGTNPNDPLVNPINSPEVLAKFPPTLLITGTRAMEMSSTVYTHNQLVKLGV
jgi:epsilon-lactone hydrolase